MNLAVATEILNQLGGKMFILMTGSKNFTSDKCALSFHLAKNASRAKYCRIELMPNDTYTVTFLARADKNFNFAEVAKFEGAYCDQLQNIFSGVTGLYTKL